jgi:hypothetical protein
MPRHKKTIEDFENEATWVGECLVHHSPIAPRRIYKLRHGELTTRQYVCHRCDTTGCLNDSHHFIGSPKDNTQDAVRKGRHSGFRKGGVRFTGHHTDEAKAKISAASKRMWEKRREAT